MLGQGFRAPYEDAAAALAYLIHYAETDESDFRAELRASPTVMGPALALMQHPGVRGEDAYAAIAAGFSVLGGLAQPVGATQGDGLMAAGVWGPSAAAAVAARLLRLDAGRTANALALAAGAAGGTFQYYFDQTEEKRLIVARAARMGVEAALLAAAGEIGPAHAYEGQAGLYALMARIRGAKPDIGGVAATVARLDGPLYLYPKFFAASSSITPSLEALAPLVQSGLRAEQVEGVALRGDPARYKVVGGKLAHFEPPATPIGAKLNYAYMVAFMLVHGEADAATEAAAPMNAPPVLDLARRVRFDPVEGDAGHVVVRLKDGRVLERAVENRAPDEIAPPALDLRRRKIASLTRPTLGVRGVSLVLACADALAPSPSGRAWTERVARELFRPR